MSDYVTNEQFDKAFIKLFHYLDERFGEVNKRFDRVESRLDSLEKLVDGYAKQVEVYHQEMLARDFQMERMQSWIEQIAKQTGVKLKQ